MGGQYRTIVCDPPWPAPDPRGWASHWRPGLPRRRLPYPALPVATIAALPVSGLADPGGSHLYLWATNHYLRDAFDVLRAWGFRYAQTLVWAKPVQGLGPGGAYAQNAEYVLFGRRGVLPHQRRVDSVWFNWPRTGKHSRKPEAFQDMVERVSPGPYVELFARRQRAGWVALGDGIDGQDMGEALRAHAAGAA